MVGVRKKCSPRAPAATQHQKLSSRRCAQRRRVDESGERDGSLQCGDDCSTEAPAAILSQACCRQRKLKGAAGASQSGKTVKVVLHGRQIPRRTQIRSCWSSWASRSRRPWPIIVRSLQTGHCLGRRSNGITPGHRWPSPPAAQRTESQLALRPLTVPLGEFDRLVGLTPPGKSISNEKKNTTSIPQSATLAGIFVHNASGAI